MLNIATNKSLFDKYNITTLTDFYNLSTKQKDFPLYLDMGSIWPNTKTVASFIHSVGGIVCLAQPFKSTNRENINFLLSKNHLHNKHFCLCLILMKVFVLILQQHYYLF